VLRSLTRNALQHAPGTWQPSHSCAAYSAARPALAGDGPATTKHDATAGLRALNIARRSAVKHPTAVIIQIKAMLISASGPCAQSVLTAAKMFAQRVQILETQAGFLQAQIDALVAVANPGLRAAYGVGPDTAA